MHALSLHLFGRPMVDSRGFKIWRKIQAVNIHTHGTLFHTLRTCTAPLDDDPADLLPPAAAASLAGTTPPWLLRNHIKSSSLSPSARATNDDPPPVALRKAEVALV